MADTPDRKPAKSALEKETQAVDVERNSVADAYLQNADVHNFVWRDVSVEVRDRATKQPKRILQDASGYVAAGELCALMGPSGSGKTTLLNVLARREASSGANVEGAMLINGTETSREVFRRLTSYVEQDDALIGSLTVHETLDFALRLAHSESFSKRERVERIKDLIKAFGLVGQADTIIGTPIRKGISGGQKRRVSVASQLITGPKIIFLDEPTSGLDSAASWEVMSFVRQVAKAHNLIVIASIHQPSTATFQLFDKLLLLSGGQQHYFGPVFDVGPYFESIGAPMPLRVNPAEFVLELMNVDFAVHDAAAHDNLERIQASWVRSSQAAALSSQIGDISTPGGEALVLPKQTTSIWLLILLALVHRAFIKSYRDVVAYGIRLGMYIGLAIMMGTVWLRLGSDQNDIQPYINAIFFGSAFMSFMAVAYVPSFLEDRTTFIKERANGLYGSAAFMISNFIIGIPYLFLIALLFSCVSYWLTNFHNTATAFITWVMWIFLDLLAAESLVVFISSLFPNFVLALALTAFANGLWMSVGGFLVPPTILNVFWKYVFHYIDYQTWVFQGMMVNEFADRTYNCDAGCNCMYQTDLASQCKISGIGILEQYDYHTGNTGKWVGISLAIIFVYRLFGWVVLCLRR